MNRSSMRWLAAAAVIAVVAFFAGRAMHPSDSSASSIDLSADAYEAAPKASTAGLSKAGFSGFTESDTDGRTVIAGRVVQVSPASIVLEGQDGQHTTLSIAGQGSPMRLEPSTRDALKPGVTVIVRRGTDANSAAAVLIVSGN